MSEVNTMSKIYRPQRKIKKKYENNEDKYEQSLKLLDQLEASLNKN